MTAGPRPEGTRRRIRQAKFPVVKTLDTFDFLAIPSANKTLVLDLARCEFLSRKENLLLLGNSGTGKTHLALALGLHPTDEDLSVGTPAWPPASKAIAFALPPPPPWSAS